MFTQQLGIFFQVRISEKVRITVTVQVLNGDFSSELHILSNRDLCDFTYQTGFGVHLFHIQMPVRMQAHCYGLNHCIVHCGGRCVLYPVKYSPSSNLFEAHVIYCVQFSRAVRLLVPS